jgi:hypothetical protein
MSFDINTDTVLINGERFVSIATLVSILGAAKVIYDREALVIGTQEAALVASGCKIMCDDLRKTLMKLA